jgi:hypothetical protein
VGWTPTRIVTAIAVGLQVVGVLAVVVEAARLRRLFSVDQPPLLLRGIELVRQKWPWRRPRVLQLSGNSAATTGGSGTLTMKVSRPSALEDRVARLESDVDALGEQRASDQRQAAERHADVVRRQDATDARISEAGTEQRKTLEAATGARAPMHLWGVIALLVGLALSFWPEAIVTAWQWEAWELRVATMVALLVGLARVPGT